MSEEAPLCFLCGLPLGTRTEWHHPGLGAGGVPLRLGAAPDLWLVEVGP